MATQGLSTGIYPRSPSHPPRAWSSPVKARWWKDTDCSLRLALVRDYDTPTSRSTGGRSSSELYKQVTVPYGLSYTDNASRVTYENRTRASESTTRRSTTKLRPPSEWGGSNSRLSVPKTDRIPLAYIPIAVLIHGTARPLQILQVSLRRRDLNPRPRVYETPELTELLYSTSAGDAHSRKRHRAGH